MERSNALKAKKEVAMIEDQITQQWNSLQTSLGGIIGPVESEEHYDQLALLLDDLLELVYERPAHPLNGLVEVIGYFIQQHDAKQPPLALATPSTMLAWYMQQQSLGQVDLAAATAIDQSLISKHLLGKRKITLAHAKAYASYFQVPISAFVAEVR
jgi:HTH-type transcriptional regulator / antitoxin HigA